MIEQLSIRITRWFRKRKIIDKKKSDVYQYGIQQLLTLLLNLISFLIIGIIFQVILPTLLFIFFYAILRIYAGGYHASTPVRCYLFSNVIVILFIIIFKYLPMTYVECNFSLLVSLIYIILFSPVDSKNKPLDTNEKKHYRTKSIVILLAEIIVQQIFWRIGFSIGGYSISLAIDAVCFMMLLGWVKNKCDNKLKSKATPM